MMNLDNVKLYYGVDKDDPTLPIIKKVAKVINKLHLKLYL